MENKSEIKLPLSDFLDRVLIFDDEKEDADAIANELKKIEVISEWYSPEDLKGIQFHKNRQLIFCDLHMWPQITETIEITSAIRKLLQSVIAEDFGVYGLIIWTEHQEDVEDLVKKLTIDRQNKAYNTPIFVLSLSKLPYRENNYSSLLENLTKMLQEAISASLYISWGNMVKSGFNKTIASLYLQTQDYEKQNETMKALLEEMALNYSGIPVEDIDGYKYFSEDTFKAMNDVLCADIYAGGKNSFELYQGDFEKPTFSSIQEELSLFSFLNARLFLTPGALDENQIVPGNVYEIKTGSDEFVVKDRVPKATTPILIELTPPCDYSNKKIASRLVSGFIIECPSDNDALYKLVQYICAGDNRYRIWPIEIEKKISFICFDFRYLYHISDEDLKDANKYKLRFRFTHNLFADILQKFSAHAARLGENVIKPKLNKPIIEGESFLKDERVLIDRLKKKLAAGTITKDEYRTMAKARNFKIDKDSDYLSTILARHGIIVTENGLEKKD